MSNVITELTKSRCTKAQELNAAWNLYFQIRANYSAAVVTDLIRVIESLSKELASIDANMIVLQNCQ